MDLDKKYYTSEYIECNILQLVKMEPEWAAYRIQAGEKAIEQLEGEAGISSGSSSGSTVGGGVVMDGIKKFMGGRACLKIGDGSTLISEAHYKDSIDNVLVLTQYHECRKIGSELKGSAGNPATNNGTVLEIVFTNSTSVQVVIDALVKIKAALGE